MWGLGGKGGGGVREPTNNFFFMIIILEFQFQIRKGFLVCSREEEQLLVFSPLLIAV